MARGTPEVQFAFPTPEGWERNLLIGLFVAYVAELVAARAVGADQFYALFAWSSWASWDVVAAPWQPLSRFVVQGPNAIQVLISLLVLFFALPTMRALIDVRSLGEAVASAAVVGSVLPWMVDVAQVVALDASPLMGWGRLVLVPFVLLGLMRPHATVYLLILPIEARWLLWGSLAIPLFLIVLSPSLHSFELLGVWLGAYGWYQLIGPGRRRRGLVNDRKRVESELEKLRRFEVIEGGAGNSAGNRPGGDDLVN